jgi:hypothetical protein
MSLKRFVAYVLGTYHLQSRDREGAVALLSTKFIFSPGLPVPQLFAPG